MSYRRLDGTASGPEQRSPLSSRPTWSLRERHSCPRWASSVSSFPPKRRIFQISCWVRAEGQRDPHWGLTRSLGQRSPVLTLGGEPMEPQSIKNHPRFALEAEGEGEVRWWVGVSFSCRQLTKLPSHGVLGPARGSQGSPAHFRETSTDQKRSSHQSCTHLGSLSHLGIPGAFF